MGVIAAISRLAGFVRVLVVAAVLGTSYLGNAFQASNSLSNVLFELLAMGALSAVLVPSFVSLLEDGADRDAEQVAGRVLGIALAGLGVVALVGVLCAPLIARALTVGVPDSVAGDQRELVTFLVRFFLPQVLLYAAGTVASAVLQAKRRFAVTVAAPIGNTVVMVAALLLFGASVDGPATFELTEMQRWLLVVAGSGGVIAFVSILLIACRQSGFRLVPRWGLDTQVRQVLAHSAWGVVLHTGVGALLGASIVFGSSVEGAVVAYQVAWVFFLAPYAILAQPIHTAILPELVVEARADDLAALRTSVRWGLERMALLVLPVSALMMALALPAMRVVSFGEAADTGPGLLSAGLAALAVGLFPYSAFLLLTRACFALGDSRTPALVSLSTAAVGVAVMAIGSSLTEGTARVAVLGAGHTVANLLGLVVLWRLLSRRTGGSLWPLALGRMLSIAALAGGGAWLVSTAAFDGRESRLAVVAIGALLGAGAAGVIAGGYRIVGLPGRLTPRAAAGVGVGA